MGKTKYPEHEKLKASQREVTTLSNFIDFLAEQDWEIAEWSDDIERLCAIRKRPEEIIGMFLGIDPVKLEQEKKAMLNEIRKLNTQQQRKEASK